MLFLQCFSVFAKITEVDKVITDIDVTDAFISHAKDVGVDIVIATPESNA